jgi:hypothetical protein
MLLLAVASHAFPPAPSHLIYGQVRDEYGVPLSVTNGIIIFEATNNVQIMGSIVPNLEAGVNYRLNVSIDSGITPDPYKITALQPHVPFRIRVNIGAVNYLPIEMVANYATLGEPAESTRIDLTLGVDADGDGLPDAWQQWLTSILGPGARVGPNDDADGDGISNLNEYLAGTYAFQPDSGFRLNLVPNGDGPPLLEFMVVIPRTYTVYTSSDLQTWVPIPFNIPGAGPSATNLPNYRAGDVHILRVEPILPPDVPVTGQFFKVQVQ